MTGKIAIQLIAYSLTPGAISDAHVKVMGWRMTALQAYDMISNQNEVMVLWEPSGRLGKALVDAVQPPHGLTRTYIG